MPPRPPAVLPPGPAGQGFAGRRRKEVLLSLVGAVVVLAVVLAGVLWPDGSEGSGGAGESPTGAGGGSPAAAAARGAAAARALDKLPGVHLSAVYAPGDGEPATRAEMTVTAEGKATGTLNAPVTGRAAMAWSDDQLYLKGDNDFWAQQGPQYGHDLTSSGHWIAPEKRDGYYMLDSFGVNAGSLTPKSFASVVREVTSDPSVEQEDAGSSQGRRATSYTTQGRTVVLTSDAPYTVVAVGVNPVDAGPVETAAWHSSASTLTLTAGHRAVPVDDGDSYYNPYLIAVPKPATDKETAAADAAADKAAAAAVPPSSTAKEASSQGPNFTTRMTSPYLCTSKPCSYSITVTNEGDEPAEAILHVSFPGIPDRAHPLGTLAPNESKEVSGTRPNAAAGTGKTVRHTDYAWVYSPAFYGPDPKVAERLHARNLKPDDVFVATPLKPAVAMLLDLMTQGTPDDDTEANNNAVEALRSANDRGQLPLLAAIAESGRLSNTKDLAENVLKANKADNPGDVRVLEQVAHLMKTDPNAEVIYDGPYEINGKKFKTDYMVISSKGGEEIKKAFQVKTVTSRRNLPHHVDKGGEQLNGEGGGKEPESAPPGFERVLQINIEPGFADLFLKNKADLEKFLFSTRKYATVRENMCKQRKDGKGLRIQQLVIVNKAGTHVWADLSKLCEKDR